MRTKKQKKEMVTVRLTSITVPTYECGPSPTAPIFYEGRANQGAQGHVYPYPLQDVLMEKKVDKTWQCIVLENQYVHFEILPELGGRIFRAVDKTTGYDFFYRQDVIKPALIGVLGAWISGGVEWNFPHHHRTTTFMPLDYKIENEDDYGMVTLKQTDRLSRLTSEIRLILEAGSSCLKVEMDFMNRTYLPESFLFWANCAVHANEQYQVIFPPDVYYAIHHAKDACCNWPVFDGDYKGIHFDHADLSWWKNHPAPASFFCGKTACNFFGGYDHGKDAGTVIWGDRLDKSGKKFFLWGNNERARVWDQMLTDDNGPYLELMVGAFSDNQPDYTWLQPGEIKSSKHYYYPVHALGGFKAATEYGALNVMEGDDGVQVKLMTTRRFRKVKVTCTPKGKKKKSMKVTLEELAPDLLGEVLVPKMTLDDTFNVVCTGVDEAGAEVNIVTYDHQHYPERPMPVLTVPPDKPETFTSNELLYQAGQRLEQFHNPIKSCEPYYEEVLKRDPDDYRTNIAVGIRLARRNLWKQAQEHFERARARAEFNNTTPQDGTVYYYLAVSEWAQGNVEPALEWLMHCSWYPALKEMASVMREEVEMMLYGPENQIGAVDSKSRKLSRGQIWGFLQDGFTLANPDELLMEKVQEALRAQDCENANLLLNGDSENPLVLYYKGYCCMMLEDFPTAAVCFAKARSLSVDYCYPHCWETETVLRFALEVEPKDCQAQYLLGCLLRYFERNDEALECWEGAARNGSKCGDLYFCLGHAYEKAGRLDDAQAMMLKAMKMSPQNALFLREYDKLSEKQGMSAKKRLAFLQSHEKVVMKRDDVLLRKIVLMNQTGDYAGALAAFGERSFHVWEGNEQIVHDAYAEAHLGRGRQLLEAGDYAAARADFEAAQAYPMRLGVGRPYREIRGRMLWYWIGRSWQAEGKKAKAMAAFRECVADVITPKDAQARLGYAEVPYYQALAWRELGDEAAAKKALEAVVEHCHTVLGAASEEADFFAKFSESEAAAPKQRVYAELLKKAMEI